jgi:ankyrin repeat protein
LESFAIQCASNDFNQWIRAQQPIPEWSVREAKLFDLTNQCRRAVHLPDLAQRPMQPETAPLQAEIPRDTAFTQIVRQGSVQSLQAYLRTANVGINDRSDASKSLLDHAAEQNQPAIARFLIARGAKVDASQSGGTESGMAPLHRAAVADAFDVASLLIASGATVNIHGPLGTTPLILAASHGSARIARLLLDHGADVTTPTGDSKTALSEATANNHPDIVQLLLAHVPTPTVVSLGTAAGRADVDTVTLMMRHDGIAHDVSKAAKDSALRYAIVDGTDHIPEREAILALLIADGADVNNRIDNAPNTPVMMATSPELVEFLVAHGAILNSDGWYGTAADQLACNANVKDRVGMLKVLLAHHADIATAPKTGRSGLQCVLASGSPDLIALVRAQGRATQGTATATSPSPPAPSTDDVPSTVHVPVAPPVSTDAVALRNYVLELTGNDDASALVSAQAVLQIAAIVSRSGATSRTTTEWRPLYDQIREDLLHDLTPAIKTSRDLTAPMWDQAIGAHLSVPQIQQLVRFYRSATGVRYLAFQQKLSAVQSAASAESMLRLVSSGTASSSAAFAAPTDSAIARHKSLLAQSWSTLVASRAFAGVADPGGVAGTQRAVDALVTSAATTRGQDLDALEAQYSRELPEFAAFQSSTAVSELLSIYPILVKEYSGKVAAANDPYSNAVRQSVAAHTLAWNTAYQSAVETNGSGAKPTSSAGSTGSGDLGCPRFENVDNTHAPPELYAAVAECVRLGHYNDAMTLFALAGLYSNFDAARVADKTAGQAGKILVMGTFDSLPSAAAEKFRALTTSRATDKPALERICMAVRGVGAPNYYPEYMIAHGMKSVISNLEGTGAGNALEPGFDAQKTWRSLLATYLNCAATG